jgi:DNA invertase Pin-like site-specific DNA recombinase
MQAAIAYYRVSTERQGKSGLGLEAQQKAVNSFAEANKFIVIDEFIEIQSAKRKTRRLALILALEECRKEGAVLLIAKLDRLSRSVAFISTLMEGCVEFKIVDNPYAEKFTLHILAAVAEKEREDISSRTTAALAAAKLRGVELGKYGKNILSGINKAKADKFAEKMKPVITDIKAKGFRTVRSITNELNKMGIPTFRSADHRWHIGTVHQLIKRINKH